MKPDDHDTRGNPIEQWWPEDDTRVDGPYELGSWDNGGQGVRPDLYRVREAIEEGKDELFVAENFFPEWCKYRGSFSMYRLLVQQRARGHGFRPRQVHVFVGDPNTGKTFTAHSENPGAFVLAQPQPNSGVWWDGYNGQTTVIIDEFKGWMTWTFLMQLLDGYPGVKGQTKGGMVSLDGIERIIITSNYAPHEWYKGERPWQALFRRIGELRYFLYRDQDGVPVWDLHEGFTHAFREAWDNNHEDRAYAPVGNQEAHHDI